MLTGLDLATLRLCSMLASSAFAAMFVGLWVRERGHAYLLHWAASAALYPVVLYAFDLVVGWSPLLRSPVFALLAGTDLLVLTGLRSFHGGARRQSDLAVMIAVVILPVLGSAAGDLPGVSLGSASRLAMAGLATSKLIVGIWIARKRRTVVTLGQRVAACAMLAYVPVYVSVIAAQWAGYRIGHLGAILPMLADQLLLSALNIALMAMPAERAMRELQERSLRDPLTGVRNRAWLERYKAERGDGTAAVIIVDIDHFKDINDRFGHAAGDKVLTSFSVRANEVLEAERGMLARLGGDEFIAIVPDADADRAARIAKDLLLSLRDRVPDTPPATASLGVAVAQAGDDLSSVMARADHRLYEAKAAGRDRVAVD